MPRMSPGEIQPSLERGLEAIPDLTLDPEACEQIVNTTEGFPHFAHVLGLNAGLAAVQDDRDLVTVKGVGGAKAAILRTHPLANEYHNATKNPQPRTSVQ